MSEPTPKTDATETAPGEPCRHLRTKSMFYDFNRENALSIGPECATARFWCVKTSRVIGPDDDAVHRDLCVRPRECFES